ncbi:hypothetical protein [Kribbella yunnanensis]|uniref:hypothetical protein n=1 Tax=Kribbella yunnanensis TaxID=190194 RepID=UPI0031E4909B
MAATTARQPQTTQALVTRSNHPAQPPDRPATLLLVGRSGDQPPRTSSAELMLGCATQPDQL